MSLPPQRNQSMSSDQLGRLSKAQLVNMLIDKRSDVTNDGGEDALSYGRMKDLFSDFAADLKRDMNELLGAIRKDVDGVKKENMELRKEVDDLKKAVAAQQKVLFWQEKERRGHNIVVRGVPEGVPLGQAVSDCDKVKAVVEKAGGNSAAVLESRRLGKASDARPLLVHFVSREQALLCLRGKSRLRNEPAYQKVYIKPDQTAAEAKEHGRLYRAFMQAKGDPNQAGKDIRLYNGRLTVDGNVIDQVRNLHFLE